MARFLPFKMFAFQHVKSYHILFSDWLKLILMFVTSMPIYLVGFQQKDVLEYFKHRSKVF